MEFIKRNATAGKPFYAYIPFSLVHMPTLPNLEFAGKDERRWADISRRWTVPARFSTPSRPASKTTRWSSSRSNDPDQPLEAARRAVAEHVFHGNGRRDTHAVYHPLAGQSARGRVNNEIAS